MSDNLQNLSENYEKFVKYTHTKMASELFKQFLNSSPVIIPLISLIEAIIFNDLRGALFFSGSMLNFLIYYVIRLFMKVDTSNQKCFIYKNLNTGFPGINTAGLPSLHTQSVGFLCGFILTMMYLNGNYRFLSIMFCLMLIVTTCLQRYYLGCNSGLSIALGLILGFIIGKLWAWIIAPFFTPPGIASDVDYSRYNIRKNCDSNSNKDYVCKAYRNGIVIDKTDT